MGSSPGIDFTGTNSDEDLSGSSEKFGRVTDNHGIVFDVIQNNTSHTDEAIIPYFDVSYDRAISAHIT